MLLWVGCSFRVTCRTLISVSQLPTNPALQTFRKIFRNLHCLFLISQCHPYVPGSSWELTFLFLARVSPDTCSHETISSSSSSYNSDSQPLFRELACELVFTSVGIIKFTSECWSCDKGQQQLKEKGPDLEVLGWGRKRFREQEVVLVFPPNNPSSKLLEKCWTWASITTYFCWLLPSMVTSCWSSERS